MHRNLSTVSTKLWRIAELGEQHTQLSRKLRGHYAYYGITGNQRSLQSFREQVRRIWLTWLSRRNRQDQITWETFARLEKRYSLPPPGLSTRCLVA